MARKTSAWTQNVRAALRRFSDAGLTEAPAAPHFDWCEHVCVKTFGLEGYAVIHQRNPKQPFCFCVFEPNPGEEHGVGEVFERDMVTLEELPLRVAEWKSFRETTDSINPTSENADHLRWLQAVAVDRKKSLDRLNESSRLRLAGDSARAWKAAGFVVKVPAKLSGDVPPQAAQQLLEDFNSVAPDLLAWHLDRDDTGKPFLKRRVPLFRYDRNPRKRQTYCLVVALPEKRTGQPEIRAEWLDPDAQTVRLDAMPELFDVRVADNFTQVFLGAETSQVNAWCEPGARSRSTFMMALRDQFSGRFNDAADRAKIELDSSVVDSLRCRRVAHMCTCCAPLDKQLQAWSAVIKRALLESNLPRFGAIMQRDSERAKRKPHHEPIPILPFPMQRHIRKAHLAVVFQKSGNPRLRIETTGSGNRVPLSVWRRPVDFDLFRANLLTPGDVPAGVAKQWGFQTR